MAELKLKGIEASVLEMLSILDIGATKDEGGGFEKAKVVSQSPK